MRSIITREKRRAIGGANSLFFNTIASRRTTTEVFRCAIPTTGADILSCEHLIHLVSSPLPQRHCKASPTMPGQKSRHDIPCMQANEQERSIRDPTSRAQRISSGRPPSNDSAPADRYSVVRPEPCEDQGLSRHLDFEGGVAEYEDRAAEVRQATQVASRAMNLPGQE